jgi:hypothetical protein
LVADEWQQLDAGQTLVPLLAHPSRSRTGRIDPFATLLGTGLLSAVADEAVIDEGHGADFSTRSLAARYLRGSGPGSSSLFGVERIVNLKR